MKIEGAEEQFAALQEVLARYGISQELINAQLDTTAVKLDRIKGAGEDAFASIGQALGKVVALAEGPLVRALNSVTNGFTALTTAGTQVTNLSNQFLQGATSVEQYNAKVAVSNATMLQTINQLSNMAQTFIPLGQQFGGMIRGFVPQFQQLTASQFQFAQGLQQTGASAQQVQALLQSTSNTAAMYNGMLQASDVFANQSAEAQTRFGVALLQAAQYGQEGIAVGQGIVNNVDAQAFSFERGFTFLQQFIAAKEADIAKSQEQAGATNDASAAVNIFSADLNASAIEATNAAIQTETLKLQQEAIANISGQVNAGLLSISDGAAVLAGQLGIASGEAERLIGLLNQLAIAKARQNFGGAPENVIGGVVNLPKAVENIKQTEAITKARKAYEDFTSSTTSKLAAARQALKYATKGTEDYYNAALKVAQLEKQQASEAKKSGGKGRKGAGGPKLSDTEKLQNKQLAQQDKFNNKYEDAEKKHWDNVAKIIADAQKKIAEQEKKNEVSKRRSRAGFYAGNNELEQGVDPAKFAAQYEQAYAEAQKISQDGNKKLAEEYLAMREQQIKELRDLENEAAKVKNDENLSDEEKRQQLEYLEGRRKLIEDAQAEELKQLREKGDEINNETRERLDEEAKAYAEQTEKIKTEAERAAEATIKGQERARKAVSDTNKELAKQAGYMGNVADKANGTADSAKTADNVDNKSAVPTDATPNNPVPITTPAPIPVTTDILLVKQSELFLVRDQGVIDSLQDTTVRLESKLSEIINAVVASGDKVATSVGRVENTIGNLRTSSNGIVTP